MLEVKNLAKFYKNANGDFSAFQDISFSLGKKGFLAIQGPSGCGKTSLLLSVGALLSPNTGTVLINGQNPYTMNANERALFRARNIGFVFQQFCLIPYLNVLDNVLTPSIAYSGTNNVRARALELIEIFMLTHRKNARPEELSTGEQQRTALARTMLNNPQLILADEPSGNLDHENEDIILNYLRDFAASGGTVLMVTHSDSAVSFADTELHLQNGKIVGYSGDLL